MATDSAITYFDSLLLDVRNRSFSDAKKVELSNRANNRFAAMAPWRWLCTHEAPITLDGSQEYDWTPSASYINVPMIYLQVETTFKIIRPVGSVPQATDTEGVPAVFSVADAASPPHKVRLFPTPSSGITGKLSIISKKAHTLVTDANKGTADILHFPDQYDHIYKAILLSMMYQTGQVGDLTRFNVNAQGFTAQGAEAQAIAWAREIMPFESMFLPEHGQTR